MIKPNFKNSILNVSATFDEFLGNKNEICKINKLKKALHKKYKNVIYICFDGLGIYPLKQNLGKGSFLRKNIVKKITSVFPSTTTNATTTLHSALYPSQHGLFGWSLYFENLNQCVDIYLRKNSYTGKQVVAKEVEEYMEFDCFYDKNRSDYKITTVFPSYVKSKQNNFVFETMDDMFKMLKKATENNNENFIFAYYGEPDSTMHTYGVTSKEAKEKIALINAYVENLAKELTNSVIVITPDHGQTDITEYIKLYEDEALKSTIKTPFYLESRAVAFQVKNEEMFLKAVKKYKKDAKLYKVRNLIKKNYFGPNTEKLKMLGDYILLMKNNHKQFVFSDKHMLFKGHHTSLTKREMLLPLIIIEKE